LESVLAPFNPDIVSTVTRHIRVAGIVQGVGFRPFVWRLAKELNLVGWVRNNSEGVEIVAEGMDSQLDALMCRLRNEAPPLARVDSLDAVAASPTGKADFTILESSGGTTSTAIGPDVATCPDCLKELFDSSNRRWRHAFITCTHCGPRYTVTRTLPYDRPQTSLAPFPLCTSCAAEYALQSDRRFHAETTCCPVCGPQLVLHDIEGKILDGDPIATTLSLLKSGAIVAIKGLGGFHLACDARNPEVVEHLRLRKNREMKPFAIMVANIASLVPYAQTSDHERVLLESRERPVVLLHANPDSTTNLSGVAPELAWLGVMLPTTPIHYLLFHEAAGRPSSGDWLNQAQDLVLVMTSANLGGEPIVRANGEAIERLAGIADAILDHNRDILACCDDSVIRASDTGFQFIRRSRGYSPGAIRLPFAGPAVLSFGAYLKNTVAVTRADEAFLSPHIGDLDTAATCDFLGNTVTRLLDLLEVKPAIVAHDLHPDYFSTQAAIEFASSHGLPTLAVQHHHAHIAAVCAEHGQVAPVLGLALDGVGLGSDGEAWGGELLRVSGAHFTRIGCLRPLPLPGGDRAAREPWRMAAAVLHELGRNSDISHRFCQPAATTIAAMLQRNLNCPRTSSMGRVFDAAAGMLGLCPKMDYEAQAAIFIEQAATRYIESHGWPADSRGNWLLDGSGQLDLLPLLASLDGADDVGFASARFHACLVAAIAEWVMQAVAATRLDTIAFGGGCFLNALLFRGLRQNLEKRGLRVIFPVRAPPGDAGVALGQAWVAINSLEQ
jgi:hydrogenase maturation protein HypF